MDRRRPEWLKRILAAAFIIAIQSGHCAITADVENSPLGMLIYHGLATVADFAIIAYAANLLHGGVSRDIQRLNYCAIVANFIGWLAYLAYIPPVIYNMTITGLAYVQWIRLTWMGSDDFNIVGRGLVRWCNPGRTKLHATETNR